MTLTFNPFLLKPGIFPNAKANLVPALKYQWFPHYGSSGFQTCLVGMELLQENAVESLVV